MLAGKKQKSPTIWAEYLDGFEVEVNFRSREELQRMIEGARARRWDSKANAIVETIDDSKYREAMARQIVTNWRGLTKAVLQELVLLDEYPEGEVPYTFEDCVWLLKESKFDTWVQSLCTEVRAFQASKRAEETKNS
jgi:hypothetical protein